MKTVSREMIEGIIEQLQETSVGPFGPHDAQQVLGILNMAVIEVERCLPSERQQRIDFLKKGIIEEKEVLEGKRPRVPGIKHAQFWVDHMQKQIDELEATSDEVYRIQIAPRKAASRNVMDWRKDNNLD
jgi:hypothetical protein